MLLSLIFATGFVASSNQAVVNDVVSEPRRPVQTSAQALAQFGTPTLRQPLRGGGERLRWIKLDNSVRATMDVTTVDVDAHGAVVATTHRRVNTNDRAGY